MKNCLLYIKKDKNGMYAKLRILMKLGLELIDRSLKLVMLGLN